MQEIPTNLDYYIELFLDAFVGREARNIQDIANHFEAQSERFIDRHTKENSSQLLKTDTLNEFVRKLNEAIEYIKFPFLDRIRRNEHMIYDAMYKRGLDTTNYVKFDLKTSKFRMEDIYIGSLEGKRYTGILEYSKLESIVEGFELFTKQIIDTMPQETLSIEASNVNASTIPANKSLNLDKIINDINNAFFRLERFMEGTGEYEYFGFNNAFTLLFNEVKKPINFTIANCELIDQYWYLIQQVSFDSDKCNYDNEEASNNEGFCQDCNEMNVLMDRVEEFIYFGGTEEEPKISIKDIIKNNSFSKTQQEIGRAHV